MKIGLVADGLAKLSRTACLDRLAEMEMACVEFGTGCWSSAPHLRLDELLVSATERDKLLGEIRDRDLEISALNCSGNPLHPGESGMSHQQVTRKTIELAALLRVDRVVMMSGLPAAPGDSTPNWITTSWPPETTSVLEWQWKERVIPYWQDLVLLASRRGIKLCLEQHGMQCVYNNASFFRLREAVGPTIGVNFDPSHLLWMGGDPVRAIEALGECVYHVHGKDTRIEPKAKANGLIDTSPVTPVGARAWNYVTLGHGESVRSWLRIVETLKSVGYDDVISIENEDYLIPAEEAILSSNAVLQFCISTLESTRLEVGC
jgi:sugar phosphate isomerase/epimerase